MGWFSDDHQEAYDQCDNHPHQASLTHELIGGAAAYEAARAYENHCERNGQPVNHATAKALLAGFAGAAVDRLVETKGLDAWDAHQRNRAREQAEERLSEGLANQYDN